jgi:hypothetical protein
MARRAVGRPPKVGKFKYLIRTGSRWGNLGQDKVAWTPRSATIVKDTDTECKRAAQDFFRKFTKNARHFGTAAEQDALNEVISVLDSLRTAENEWDPDSFKDGQLYFEWSCLWGDQGTFTAALTIDRVAADKVPKQGGLL